MHQDLHEKDPEGQQHPVSQHEHCRIEIHETHAHKARASLRAFRLSVVEPQGFPPLQSPLLHLAVTQWKENFFFKFRVPSCTQNFDLNFLIFKHFSHTSFMAYTNTESELNCRRNECFNIRDCQYLLECRLLANRHKRFLCSREIRNCLQVALLFLKKCVPYEFVARSQFHVKGKRTRPDPFDAILKG